MSSFLKKLLGRSHSSNKWKNEYARIPRNDDGEYDGEPTKCAVPMSSLGRRHSSNKRKQQCHYKLGAGKNEYARIPKGGFLHICIRRLNDDGEYNGEATEYAVPISYLSCPPLEDFLDRCLDDVLDISCACVGPLMLPGTPDEFEQILEACWKISRASPS